MANQFGHGFVTTIVLIAQHFAHPPDQAWPGAGDHVEGLILPERFRGTEVEDLTTSLRKKVIWHQQGTMDKEDAQEVIYTLRRLVIAIDQQLGIADASLGEFA
jgi:4-hydroxy-3-methylbut-2-enyl diphosphate reductase IspH